MSKINSRLFMKYENIYLKKTQLSHFPIFPNCCVFEQSFQFWFCFGHTFLFGFSPPQPAAHPSFLLRFSSDVRTEGWISLGTGKTTPLALGTWTRSSGWVRLLHFSTALSWSHLPSLTALNLGYRSLQFTQNHSFGTLWASSGPEGQGGVGLRPIRQVYAFRAKIALQDQHRSVQRNCR